MASAPISVSEPGVGTRQCGSRAHGAAEAIEGRLRPVTVRFIGKAAMARNKLASGRAKDLADVELLQGDE